MNQSLVLIKQNSGLAVSLTAEDMIYLDISNEKSENQLEPAIQQNNQSVSLFKEKEQKRIAMFSNLYNTDVPRALSNDDNLLTEFASLKGTNNEETYKTMLKLFNAGDELVDLINKMKILHNDLLAELEFLKNKINDKYDPLIRALHREAEDQDAEKTSFKKVLQSANFSGFIKNCDMKINEVRMLNSKIKELFKFTEERENLKNILGTQNTLDVLDNFDKEILRIEKNIAIEQEKVYKFLPDKMTNENETNFYTVKLEEIDQLIDVQKQLVKLYTENLTKLEQSKLENEEKKKQILMDTLDSKKINKIRNEQEKIFRESESKHVKAVLEINSMSSELNREISEVKEVQKYFHLVFILDESGSMKAQFDSVKESVNKVIEQRRKQPVVKDKLTVIRFNEKARFEFLNVDVTDSINMSNPKLGGTRFIPALDKLQDVLSEINGDLFIPIIFFLSDGFGERQPEVIAKCRELKSKFSTMNMLFFCIGYGEKADETTLEAMTAEFNNNKNIISIGEEKCKLYYTVHNESDLEIAFSAYEKLFFLEKNIVKTKMDMLETLLNQKDKMNKQTSGYLKEMFETRRQYEEKESKEKAIAFENINKSIDENIANLKQQLGTASDTIDKLSKEKKNLSDNLANFKVKKTELDFNCKVAEKQLEEYRKQLESLIDKKNKQTEEMIKNAKSNQDDEYKRCLDKLKTLNVNIDEKSNFKMRYTRFTNNFYEFKRQIQDLEVKSNYILNELKIILNKIRSVENEMNEFKELNDENLKNKIWPLITVYYENKHKIITNLMEEVGEVKDADVFIAICKKLLSKNGKLKSNDEKAIELILDDLTPQSLFSKMEEDPKFAETFIDKYLQNRIKKKIEIKKAQITSIDEDEDLNEQQKAEEKKKIQSEIEKLTDYKNQFDILSISIEKIMETLNADRKFIKECYTKSLINKKFKSKFHQIKYNVLPEIEQLQIAYEKSQPSLFE